MRVEDFLAGLVGPLVALAFLLDFPELSQFLRLSLLGCTNAPLLIEQKLLLFCLLIVAQAAENRPAIVISEDWCGQENQKSKDIAHG